MATQTKPGLRCKVVHTDRAAPLRRQHKCPTPSVATAATSTAAAADVNVWKEGRRNTHEAPQPPDRLATPYVTVETYAT